MADDTVTARLIGGRQFDVRGPAALVWIALDTPADNAEIEQRLVEVLTGIDNSTLASAVDDLRNIGLVVPAT